ncbi:hypothetical protein HO173_008767 [Letharia columbiana]|uniref:Asl1-like glycosyl hydrolase catalytic domain-containing protein n=1 Tax=Letharia columbiana TaxID=112416 RepID=A0A8H6FQU2_9LECA|nr:uncharacterized protein HO173_008767 [Letharia columbiana]KAF6233011.1 hypothetical protein HO173_008767 [Letharia columbiana]
MAVLNIALLAALLPAVLAIPQHGSMYHGPHKGSKPPGGWPLPTGGPFQSGQAPFPPKGSGGAPFPAGNSTAGGATATGTGMVTIKSTINLIPVPLTSSAPVAGQSPATTGAAGGSGQSGSAGSPSGAPGGPGQAGNPCGPATVTVTTANTVTVTVQASPSPSPIESPQSSAPVQSSVVPYPMYNSSIPIGPTGSGSLLTSYVAPTPPSSSSASSSASPKIVQEASDGQVFVPATRVEAGIAATTSSSVAIKADYHPPAANSHVPPVPAPASPPSSSSVSTAPSVPAAPAPASSSSVSTVPSAPASSPSTGTGSTGSTGVKARGLLYSYNNKQLSPDESLAQANAAVNDACGWMTNWDSSPATGSGPARGGGKVEYAAQLWGTDATHLAAWLTNAITPWVIAFNEPERCDGGGSCLTYQEAAAAHTAHIAPLRTGGTKVTTPCTQNNIGSSGIGSDYMASFLAQFPSNSFDAICCHWYGPGTQEGLNGSDNPQSLAATVAEYQRLRKQYGIAELWITEGGPEDAAPDTLTTFLEWLDDPSNGVDRYAWNGLNSPSSVVEVGTDSTYMSS